MSKGQGEQLTLVAIDGQGKQTDDYITLLEDSCSVFRGGVPLLLSSDPQGTTRRPWCRTIRKLDYIAYSRFCIKELHEHITSEFVLMIQLDGFIVNPDCWDPSFLQYDYVGSPWKSKPHRVLPDDVWVGNGGFSLRSRRLLEAVAGHPYTPSGPAWNRFALPRKHHGNEDYFTAVVVRESLEAMGMNFAPVETAARFGVQSGDQIHGGQNLKTVFGFHGAGLMAKAKRRAHQNGVRYRHLDKIRKSFFPLGY